ncbi:NHL repeat-containing protein [Spartinivicinus ruber]|uniref:hypothetical protein n=1 Tax=Spartinivicinus ruber TaxID=2683272 RepID=UPI001E32D3D8|nr:hypothetical protein [Spartinivicinus ruber]
MKNAPIKLSGLSLIKTALAKPWRTTWLLHFFLQLLLGTGFSLAYAGFTIKEYALPSGSRPHDVAPAIDGGVWYTAQRKSALGYLNPDNGQVEHIPLGEGSTPHGVIVGPDGAP